MATVLKEIGRPEPGIKRSLEQKEDRGVPFFESAATGVENYVLAVISCKPRPNFPTKRSSAGPNEEPSRAIDVTPLCDISWHRWIDGPAFEAVYDGANGSGRSSTGNANSCPRAVFRYRDRRSASDTVT